MVTLFQIRHVSVRSVSRHTKLYVYPHIIATWRRVQAGLLDQVRQAPGGVIVQGDARSDSPGHCAKYGESRISIAIKPF